MDLPDDELVRRAQHGDREAFTLLIRRFERPVLAVAFAVLADSAGAGDVAQESFVRAWQRLGELQQPARFGGWLCSLTRNLARDAVRKERRDARLREASSVEQSGTTADAVSEHLDREKTAQLEAALAELDEVTRAAIMLRYYENLGSKQIAELLSLTPSAVDMRLSRGRAELRNKLSDEHGPTKR